MGKHRISTNTAIVMVVFAVSVDLSQIFIEWTLSWILIGFAINWLIDIGMQFGYWMWFRAKGVNFRGTIALIFFGLGFLELFPGLTEFPLWMIDVLAVILLTNMEDRLGMSGKQLVEDKRTGRILKRGIMRATNRGMQNRVALQEKVMSKSGNRWESESEHQKVGTSVPIANTERDAKIAAQRQKNPSKNDQNNQQTS